MDDPLRVPLVGLLGTLRRKPHWSGGDAEFVLERGDAAVAVGSVAVLDVAGEGVGEGVPVEVVGVRDDEFVDRAEVELQSTLGPVAHAQALEVTTRPLEREAQ